MSTAIERNSDRASSYAMAGEFVQGNDPDLIYAATQRALSRARSGEGGTILEIETVRLKGHFTGDQSGYITGDNQQYQIDPIPVYRARLISEGVLDEQEALDIEAKVGSQVDGAISFALEAEYPGVEDALNCTFA
jgi:pyruvate dehydrogenase E1 component alpha subunit